MIYLVAIFIAAGGALIGWNAGLAMFIAAFELLRLLHLEALLDSPTALTTFRYAHVAFAIITGLWLLHRWRPRDHQTVPTWKVVTIATVAALGSALLAVPIVIVLFKQAQTLTPLLIGVLTGLAAGAVITAMAYRKSASWPVTGLRGALAAVMATTVIWLGFAFDAQFSGHHARLGLPRTVLIDIRIPGAEPPETAALRIAMRDAGRDLPGELHHRVPGRGGYVRVSVPLVLGASDRTVVLTLSDGAERLLRIDLPRRPRPTRDFGPWLRFEGVGDPPYEARYLVN
jgi:hypothetical protein